MNKKICLFALLSIFLLFKVFAENPTEKEVFNFYCACANGDLNIVQNFVQKYSESVNLELSTSAYKDFATYLISKRFITVSNKDYFISAFFSYPICIAARYNNLEIVNLLIKNNANVNIKDSNGKTPLMLAAEYNFNEIVDLLLKNKADVNAKANNGFTPLIFSVMYYFPADEKKQIETVDLLLKYKADVNIILDITGWTPLIYAVYHRHTECVKLMLKEEADVNAKAFDGCTPLMFAVEKKDIEISELLLKNKADINAKNNKGYTPLMIASFYGYTEIVDFLVKNNADVNIQNNEGKTALMFAAKNRFSKIVELLLNNNADVNIQDNDGYTVLANVSNAEIEKMILNRGIETAETWTCSRFKILANKNYGKFICIKNANIYSINCANSIYIDDNDIIEAYIDQDNSDLVEKILSLYERRKSNPTRKEHATFYGIIDIDEFDKPILNIIYIE